MPQTLVKILAHIVFSTKNRADMIPSNIENALYAYFHGIIENNGAKLIIAGGTANHVHLLVSLPKLINLPELVGDLKRGSSKWIKRDQGIENFYWQKGYGAFSVSQSQFGTIVDYIKNQKRHHAKRDFRDEFRALLEKYEIDYDERYVWD